MLLAQAALLAQKDAYFHKWQVHRRLRPECFAGRFETQARGQRRYDSTPASSIATALPAFSLCMGPDSVSSVGARLQRRRMRHILKAFFDADYVPPQPVEVAADGLALPPWRGATLTLGNEIDKLANIIALVPDA